MLPPVRYRLPVINNSESHSLIFKTYVFAVFCVSSFIPFKLKVPSKRTPRPCPLRRAPCRLSGARDRLQGLLGRAGVGFIYCSDIANEREKIHILLIIFRFITVFIPRRLLQVIAASIASQTYRGETVLMNSPVVCVFQQVISCALSAPPDVGDHSPQSTCRGCRVSRLWLKVRPVQRICLMLI